ncbi:MAG: hypothetical protein HY521_04900 [Proteobacteria bacterium]|nr:hypothetical protein [Pseudomonadota bacterium]
MRTLMGSLSARPALWALALAAAAAGAGWVLRYHLVEPEAFGVRCQAAGAPWWCPLRTGLIRATEVNGLGIGSFVVALVSLVVRGRAATMLVALAMGIGGAGLYLYNTSFAAAGVLIGLLRATRIEPGRDNP